MMSQQLRYSRDGFFDKRENRGSRSANHAASLSPFNKFAAATTPNRALKIRQFRGAEIWCFLAQREHSSALIQKIVNLFVVNSDLFFREE